MRSRKLFDLVVAATAVEQVWRRDDRIASRGARVPAVQRLETRPGTEVQGDIRAIGCGDTAKQTPPA